MLVVSLLILFGASLGDTFKYLMKVNETIKAAVETDFFEVKFG